MMDEKITIERTFAKIYKTIKQKGEEDITKEMEGTITLKNGKLDEIKIEGGNHGYMSLSWLWIKDIKCFLALKEVVQQLECELKREGLIE